MADMMLSEDERVIVDIVNPWKNERELPEVLPIDFIINNRICYLIYEKVGEKLKPNFGPEELERIREKAESMKLLMDEASTLSKIFKSNNIDFVLVFRAIRSKCDSTDIDVIVRGEQDGKIKKLLKNLGYFNTVWGDDRVYACSKNGKTIQIDITPEEDKQALFDEGKTKILINKNTINGIYVPSPNDELIMLILKSILGCRPIRLSDIVHISYLLEECDVDYIRNNIEKSLFVPFLQYVYMVNMLCESLYNRSVESPLVVVADKLHNNSKILKLLSKIETKKLRLPFYSTVFAKSCLMYKLLYDVRKFRYREIIPDIVTYFVPITARIKLLKSALSRKRIIVCFAGMDGTGKTSHATKIVERFKDMGVPCQYVWYGWTVRVSYPLMALIYLITGGYRRKDYHKNKVLRRIWNYVIIIDFLYLYLAKIKIPHLIGKNVVCDRYVYAWMADLMYDGLYSENATKILLKLIAKPDLVFMLDVPEDVSDLRKDDTKDAVNIKDSHNAIDYLSIHRKNYLNIAKSLNIPVIDTTKEFMELNENFYNIIIQTYMNEQK